MIQQRLILHIGTGKTGTTYLQKQILPELHKRNYLVFLNDSNIYHKIRNIFTLNRLYDSCQLDFIQEKIVKLKEEMNSFITNSSIPVFLSMEALHGWDPCSWEDNAKMNELLFYSQNYRTEIVLTLRETYSYLSSLYLESVHQGNIHSSPSEFFLSKEEHVNALKFYGRSGSGTQFICASDLDYVNLFELYKKRFKVVYAFNKEEVFSLEILYIMNICSYQDLCGLKKYLKEHKYKIQNQSYSEIAMKLTYTRNKILDFFDLSPKSQYASQISQRKFILNSCRGTKFLNNKNLSTKRYYSTAKKLLSYSRRLLTWRFLMQFFVNRCLPYKKPSIFIPSGIIKPILDNNNSFLQQPLESRIYIDSDNII